ncbi:MAG: PD-(D/E)XK nuclease family protein [Gammaproteobacteria bacterium]|nr:PD-(D/E)XK nuclease family protein [Gammaproteobacteria bacterium]MBU1979278.1 PD-(D/E)XK nuclease family protein [Gammaproteobacteria bacterium]
MRKFPADTVSALNLLRIAARDIVALEQEQLPRLTGLVILLPNFHAVDLMGEALCEAAGASSLLLPRMITLTEWAGGAVLGREILPDSCRAALLYQALRERKWFADADLWHVSRELLSLFDDMARQGTGLPASYPEFVALLEQAYRTRAGEPLQFEARLVHELWYAMSLSGDGRVDSVTAYHLRLAGLADNASSPLYAVGLSGLTPMEQDFFRRYGERQPVHLYGCGGEVPADDLSQLVQAAWQSPTATEAAAPGLRERATGFRQNCPASPLSGRLELLEAHSLEQEAQAVDSQIREWLLAGKSSIAVIAQDRLVARRARALLERGQILVADETGWTLSTVAASAVVMRWLDVMASRFHHLDLLDLLKSPLIFADWEGGARKHAVYGLEQLVRRHSVISGLHHYRGLAQREGAEDVLTLLARLEQAQARFGVRKRGLAAWLASLLESLEVLGLRQGLTQDLAGEQLLRLLERLQKELGQDQGLFTLSEWRRWLDSQLEAATFRDTGITSPVVFTHLGAARLRRFDGVIVAGGDAAHFPGRGKESAFFNQSVRAQLGLPTFEQDLRQMEQNFTSLLADCGTLLITWQGRKNAEPNLASPWVDRLEVFHQLAYGEELPRRAAEISGEAADILPPLPATARPTLTPELVPVALSASGYNSLMDCPYQFYARHALHLNELDEVQQALEKKDYGEHVHAILHHFHQRYPAISGCNRAEMEQALRDISREEFRQALESDYLARAWALRWGVRISAYLDWQAGREQEGWRWHDGELWRTRELELEGGRSLTLKGRIDRVDTRSDDGEEAYSVLDYKTQSRIGLQKKLETPGEDVQLPVYALLLDEAVVEAAFVPVDEDGSTKIVEQDDIYALSKATGQRLRELFNALYQGAPLPAQGSEQACAYCEMSGLCRKDYHDGQ